MSAILKVAGLHSGYGDVPVLDNIGLTVADILLHLLDDAPNQRAAAGIGRHRDGEGDDARALLRQVFQTDADLTPDLVAGTLTVKLHHLTQAAHDQAIEKLLVDLNATQTVFPGTKLILVFKLGSA